MDRNTFTGLFLILIILVGSTFFLKPSESEIKKEKYVQDSIARVKNRLPSKSVSLDTAKTLNQPKTIDSALLSGPFGSALTGSNEAIVIENKLLKVKISPKGGRIISVELKNFKTFDQKPLIMFEGEANKFGLVFNVAGKTINTNDLYFTFPDVKTIRNNVVLRLNYDQKHYIDYSYMLDEDSYKVGFSINTNEMQDIIDPAQKLVLNWETILKQKEKDIASEHRYSTAYYKPVEDEVDHLSVSEDEEKELTDGKIQWISFKQHFFSNVLIAKNGFDKGGLAVKTSAEKDVVKGFAANMQIPFGKQADMNFPMEFYFGPNKFTTLKAQGYDIEKQVDLGYWPLKYINRFIVIPVFNWFTKLNWNYGLIILALTILLKVVLFPLTYKSYLSMAKMRVLKPEMDEIKGKVGDDNPTLLQQEYLKLYKKAGVNPLGGCLPMLLQLPIIMAFFFFFPNLFELRQESFLWMKDLSTYDAFFNLGFTLPFLGNHISLMCILMTISTLIYTYFNNQVSGATGQMKYIGYITPIIFFGVLNSYPSGLNYYYFLANMLTFAQQYLIRMFVDDEKIHAKIQENKKKPVAEGKAKSGFQKRMDDYMRTQQSKKPNQTVIPKK
ncbi:MAG: membrane protein insertase YidC [Daejeonella sp.]